MVELKDRSLQKSRNVKNKYMCLKQEKLFFGANFVENFQRNIHCCMLNAKIL